MIQDSIHNFANYVQDFVKTNFPDVIDIKTNFALGISYYCIENFQPNENWKKKCFRKKEGNKMKEGTKVALDERRLINI